MPLDTTLTDIIARLRQGQLPPVCHPEPVEESLSLQAEQDLILSRLPTISGLRRRGIPASAVRQFAYNIGVTKFNSITDNALPL